MFKWLITVIFCFYAMVSLAQTAVTEIPHTDTTGAFHHLSVPNSGNIISLGKYYKDYLQAKTINPGDLVHTPWPATWEEFKKEFIEMKVEDPIANLDLHLPSPKEMRNEAYPQGGIVMQGPISFLYDKFSKEAMSKRIYAELTKKDEAAVRYNKVVISKITGMHDEDEIRKFIDFCALRVQFILDASDYELYAAIMDCYQNFCINEYDTLVPSSSE